MAEIEFHGLDLVRSRDCVVFVKDITQTALVSSTMLAGGWVGGQGVQWAQSVGQEPMVTYSAGHFGGFMVWGSDEVSDKFTAMTGQFLTYGYGVIMYGEALISTSSYERYTYASRTGGGPLVPINYLSADPLYFSLRGLWTKEDELTLSGNPAAPALMTGIVAQVPKAATDFWLGIQTSM